MASKNKYLTDIDKASARLHAKCQLLGARLHWFGPSGWGTRDMLQVRQEQAQSWRPGNGGASDQSLALIVLAVGTCIAYSLAARLSLILQTQPDGVAVFWPAAGVSSGTLIALGRDVRWSVAVLRWSVAVGVIAATVI